ncbi:MAG: calcium/sodium antiporter [Polyangiales bacterium]
MQLTLDVLLAVVGVGLLTWGGDALVRGASGIALLAQVRPTIVGLTIVAAGTSMPELVVSVVAAWRGSADLCVANVVGSNIFNVTVVLGVAALFRPLAFSWRSVRRHVPAMLLALAALHVMGRDGHFDRIDGFFLVAALLVFILYTAHLAQHPPPVPTAHDPSEDVAPPVGGAGRRAWLWSVVLSVLGMVLLGVGSSALVQGATRIARLAGVSERVIGLTMVAAGTSLPELATSAMASWRGRNDIAIANAVGSTVFNCLGIIGLAAVLQPLAVHPHIVAHDHLWMLASGGGLVLLLRLSGQRLGRINGLVLLTSFVVYFYTLM